MTDTRNQISSKKRMTVVIAVAASLLVITGLFWMTAANKGDYRVDSEAGVVTYNGKPVEGCNADEFKTLTYLTAKDSTHVYFRGKLQPELDASSLRMINMYLVMDKNGIYREPTSGKTLRPLDNVDNATFRMLASGNIFADKDHVYYVDPFSPNPVVAMTGPDTPDPATTQTVGPYFFKDASAVYFCPTGGRQPKPCPEIDAASFEGLTGEVYKDKNNVYFISTNIEQTGGDDGKENYDILRGADAPTFRMIDHSHFEDKDNTWTIDRNGGHR